MLKWFRGSARVWAASLILWSFAALGTLSATAHSVICADELSAVAGAGHFRGSHVVHTAQTREAPTHCVLCHWMQSFRAAGVRASRIVFTQKPVTIPPLSPVQRTRAAARLDLPPRAPPA